MPVKRPNVYYSIIAKKCMLENLSMHRISEQKINGLKEVLRCLGRNSDHVRDNPIYEWRSR
ncbi:hypothetical protein COOONC_09516 [Cooperia oncophora]